MIKSKHLFYFSFKLCKGTTGLDNTYLKCKIFFINVAKNIAGFNFAVKRKMTKVLKGNIYKQGFHFFKIQRRTLVSVTLQLNVKLLKSIEILHL